MSKTILAVALACALAACGGKEHRAKASSTARRSEATRSGTSHPTQQKKKATKPDTTRAKNPLTN
jgi:hypothetical protein